jgi:hypothetical protein
LVDNRQTFKLQSIERKMNAVSIFIIIWAAMISMSFWESSIEGRNAWDKNKSGWRIRIGKYVLSTRYHLWVWIMWILLLYLPIMLIGWNSQLFGILLSALLSGFVIEDFFWYVFNPKVKFKEFYSDFSDYYPWLKIGKQKIIPWFYILGILTAILSWYFIWR